MSRIIRTLLVVWVIALVLAEISSAQPPTLIAPPNGAVMDNGCAQGADSMIWDFVWHATPNATLYHLYVIHPDVLYPLIDYSAITDTTYHNSINAYTGLISGWTWKVRAFVSGNWTDWSATGTFGVEPAGADCCCKGITGNVDCDPDEIVDIADLTRIIDNLYISMDPLCCENSANTDGDAGVDIADLTALINYLYIKFEPLAACK